MSRSRHRQHTAHQWNPPPPRPDAPHVFPGSQVLASATECTGLVQKPITSQSESVDMTQLYAIHEQKPQGNIGKGNPNNDPSEIHFHRQ